MSRSNPAMTLRIDLVPDHVLGWIHEWEEAWHAEQKRQLDDLKRSQRRT